VSQEDQVSRLTLSVWYAWIRFSSKQMKKITVKV